MDPSYRGGKVKIGKGKVIIDSGTVRPLFLKPWLTSVQHGTANDISN